MKLPEHIDDLQDDKHMHLSLIAASIVGILVLLDSFIFNLLRNDPVGYYVYGVGLLAAISLNTYAFVKYNKITDELNSRK
jgi:lipid-A-disaccharide synthase-like uncharacterized protein